MWRRRAQRAASKLRDSKRSVRGRAAGRDTSQSDLLFTQIGLERSEALLLGLQLDKAASHVDASIGSRFLSNHRLIVDRA